ncbi:MAG: histidine kinase, partial [Verrucomicrobia bacterium]|nr:histidine kinase [Verrucomicrobiota bacterium]
VWSASLWSTNALLDLAELRRGSRLELTGLCRFEVAAQHGGESACPWCDGACQLDSEKPLGETRLNLWLRSPGDVRVLKQPIRTFASWTIVFPVLFLLAVLMAALTCRRLELRRLAVRQVALQAQIHESEQQLRRSLEERERLGQDLHDDIIQSIYAVGLGLEGVHHQLRASPDQAETRLAAAVHSLNEVIGHVRAFIAGLEPKLVNGRELKTALKSLALTSGDTQVQYAIEVDAAAANLLTSTEATQLLHIAKEAMSNSLRHARASRIAVSLQLGPSGVCLEIQDDGVGFDPKRLRNMAARAAALGARFELISAPGTGCRMIVQVLLPKHQ